MEAKNDTIPLSRHIWCWTVSLQAEEITLTIGQAFDLAYKRYLSSQTEGEDRISRLERSVDEDILRIFYSIALGFSGCVGGGGGIW